jgi:N-acetylornithine carbamoyltransferase
LKHFLAPADLTLAETRELFQIARELRVNPIRTDLHGKSVGLLFFNPSLRTRSSMDVGIYQLGGHADRKSVV